MLFVLLPSIIITLFVLENINIYQNKILLLSIQIKNTTTTVVSHTLNLTTLFPIQMTTPSHDKIIYSMIRRHPKNVKDHLLRIFNKFFRDTFFPRYWKLAIIFPIPKPGKDHSNPHHLSLHISNKFFI